MICWEKSLRNFASESEAGLAGLPTFHVKHLSPGLIIVLLDVFGFSCTAALGRSA